MNNRDGAGIPSLDDLDRLVQTRPAEALAVTRRWLAESPGDGLGVAAAWGAMARALFELGQIDSAVTAMRRALSMLEETGDDHAVAITLSGAAILAEAGLVDEAIDRLAGVERVADASHRGRILMQRSYVLSHAGRLTDSLEQIDLAEPLLIAGGDDLGLLRLAVHRGVVQLQRGRLVEAEADFRLADELAQSLGQTAMRAGIASNLGVLLGRRRRLRGALEQFDMARAIHAQVGQPGRMVAVTEIDRAEVLMHAGLVVDAVEAAENALRNVEPTGNRVVLGDSQLLLARTQLAAGRRRAAARMAGVAAETFRSAGRREMVPQARSIEMHAALAAITDAEAVAPLLGDVADLTVELTDHGWHQLADELRVSRIRTAYRLGHSEAASDDLELLRLGAFSGHRDVALAGWYCEAIARAVAEQGVAAIEACRFGLDLLDDIVAEAPSLAERSAAMRLGNDLSQLTIELAVEQQRPDTVLAAAEGTRARALHEELAEPRRHHALSVDGAEQLGRELASRLADRVLVEWVVARSSIWAVVFDASGARLVEVGDTNTIRRARDRVLVWLDRAAAEPDGSSRNALHAARLLDELLIGPLGLPADVGVVLVPVGLLHGIPWSGLPSLAGRSFVLAPNAQLWLDADRRASGPIHAVGLVVGPDVTNAAIERSAVERLHPTAAVAVGAGATAATVRSMFNGLDLVHVAAHGMFRSDHPLLSTLRLDDGEATLYDAMPDRVRSRLVVLSSCEGGAQGTADGSEVLGLSAVMLARGAASVLAPLTVVRDLECADFVAEVHAELATGEPFACAVAAVRQRWLDDDDLSRWAVASSFTCFGSGAVTFAGA